MADENEDASTDDQTATVTDEGANGAGQDQQGASEAGKEQGSEQDSGPLAAGAGEDQERAAPADWPEDWRTKLAGDDEKAQKRLERFKSPQDIFKAYRALEQRLSSGELKAPLPENPTEEQLAAYRKENGIPETPEGYLESLPDGLVLGDDAKPDAEEFAKVAHEMNMPPEFVAKAIEYDQKRQEKITEEQAVRDREFRQKAEDDLRAEWGNEYRANINAMSNFLDATAPTDDDGNSLKDLLLGARLSDGSILGDHPLALKWLASLSNEYNPAGTVAPGGGGSQAQSVADEIAEIEKVMRTDRATYNKDTKMQERLRQLYDAQEKLKSRAA